MTIDSRAATWASLFQGPPPAAALREQWAHGLARNQAAPEDVQHGLLGHTHHLLWQPLPVGVVDAAVDHPDRRVRGLLAEAQPHLTAQHWARLLAAEQDPRQRWILTGCAVDRTASLTPAAYRQLAADPAAPVRAEAAGLHRLPPHTANFLAADPAPTVRAAVCRNAWPQLADPVRRHLSVDSDDTVRAAALLQHHRDPRHPMSRAVFDAECRAGDRAAEDFGERAAATCCLAPALAARLAASATPALRRALARNPHLAPDLVAVLAADTDHDVRYEVSVRPDLTEEQRAAVPVTVDPDGLRHALPWVVALHDDPAAMRRLAASSHPVVRSSVARARRLPPDVVARLARDEDRVVRLFLAESCDDAPATLLLEVWQWWTGSLSFPGRPRSHPNFPRHGLLRYATDPKPRLRQLALDDPESTAALAERLRYDPDPEVRLRAATDPRLSAASAVQLLDDAHERVRRAARGHPALPGPALAALLRNTGTAQDAARHPALPVDVMRRMLVEIRGGHPIGPAERA
ncbi:PE-PGRS family protein [Streptomyces noursei]|uniref:PE-PGRS family protein n=2 Tax=Streptomyces TaxID=1883 RepID=A0A2N8PHI6_STRNR|nr:PE-PGRS family protein [Streptomyces noursei]PNE40458.1 PE-PGRS family protein [Streptomyces noursei]